MATADIIQCAVVAGICFILIMLRTGYRIFCGCNVHQRCPRQWHKDDVWMTFSLLPLIGRAIAITWSARLLDFPVDASVEEKNDAKVLSGKLLIPARIFYLSFLWCCKFCLLELWSLYLTYIAVCLATTLECRPIAIAWNGDPAGAHCRKARANLITMAVCNITTDLALILFPISILKGSGIEFYRLIRLSLLFALGSLVIITTVIRLPLILRDDAQNTRSRWASIEICVACFIAQAPFFQAVWVDRRVGSHTTMHNTSSCNGTDLRSRTQVTAVKRSRAVSGMGMEGIEGKQEDEIGLWEIEKRVSCSVSEACEGRGSCAEIKREETAEVRMVEFADVDEEDGRNQQRS